MAAGTTSLNAPWSRLVNTTIANYIKGEQINILRNRKLSALLQKRGRITYNWSGINADWKVRYRRAPLVGFADGDTVTFARQDRNKTAQLGWRGYSAADSMSKGEFLQNRSKEAIINLFSDRTKLLRDDVQDQFCEQLYVDGTTAANSKNIHGLETFLGYGTVSAGNGALLPTANYAGLNETLGAYGGTWSSSGSLTWPNGRGDPQYDFWSPLIVDVGDSMFGTSPKWGSGSVMSCVEAISFAIIKSKKSPAKEGTIDLFLINDEAYRQYIAQLRSLQRIVVNGQIPELVGLGFDDVVQQDGGKDVTWEYGLPTASNTANGLGVIGYGINLDGLELRSQQAEVWVAEGPSFDDATKAWRWSIDFFGNLTANPRGQVKLYNATTTTDPAQL